MPEKIQRHIRIVPDILSEQNVEYHPGDKLDAGYHERAHHAAYHGVERGEPVAQNIKISSTEPPATDIDQCV